MDKWQRLTFGLIVLTMMLLIFSSRTTPTPQRPRVPPASSYPRAVDENPPIRARDSQPESEQDTPSQKQTSGGDSSWQSNAALRSCVAKKTIAVVGDLHARNFFETFGLIFGAKFEESFVREVRYAAFDARVLIIVSPNLAFRNVTSSLAGVQPDVVFVARGLRDLLHEDTRPEQFEESTIKALSAWRRRYPNATFVGYMPHYFHPPSIPHYRTCVALPRVLRVRRAFASAFSAVFGGDARHVVIDAFEFTAGLGHLTDAWGHHYAHEVRVAVLLELLRRREGLGWCTAASTASARAAQVVEVVRAAEYRNATLEAVTNLSDEEWEAWRSSAPECDCEHNEFHESCPVFHPLSNVGNVSSQWKKPTKMRKAIADHYCKLGRQYIADPREFKGVTALDIRSSLGTDKKRWQKLMASVCNSPPAHARRCLETFGESLVTKFSWQDDRDSFSGQPCDVGTKIAPFCQTVVSSCFDGSL